MGQTVLSSLSPLLGIPESARGAEPKERADTTPSDSAQSSIFSKFLKRRDAEDTTPRAIRANAVSDKPEAKAEPKGSEPRKAAKSGVSESDQANDRDEDDADGATDDATAASDSAAPEDAKPERAAAATEEADADDQVTLSDPATDDTAESLMMGFFAGQVPFAQPAPGGFGDAAIVATPTSAPAPIPNDITATLPPSIPAAADPQAAIAPVAPEAAPAAPLDFAQLLAAAPNAPAPAPAVPQTAAAPQAAPVVQAEAAPALPKPAEPATALPTEGEASDEAPALSDNAPPPLAVPRRLGRQEPVLPNAAPATPTAAVAAAPNAPTAAPGAPVAQAAPQSAGANAAESKDGVEATAATAGDSGASITALPASPTGVATTGGASTKFELASVAEASSASDQILAHVAALPKGKGTQFSLQLEPLHLGKVEVVMSIQRDGALHMQIQAESRETLAALQRDASQLERSLQDLGLKTDAGSLQFSLKQDNQQSASAQFGADSQGQRQQGRPDSGTPTNDDNQTRPLGTVAYRPVTTDGLDIRV